jgi:hypothetical protein
VLIDMQPNLGGTLKYVKEWFYYYPYACLEQKTTAAAGLQDTAVWAIIMADLPTYLDKDGLAKFYPSEWRKCRLIVFDGSCVTHGKSLKLANSRR